MVDMDNNSLCLCHDHIFDHILSVPSNPECCRSKLSRVSLHRSSLRLQRKTHNINTFEGHIEILSVPTNPECCRSKLSRVSLQRSSLRLQRKTHNINTLRVMSKFCQFHQNQNVADLNCQSFSPKIELEIAKKKPTTSTL